MSEAGEVMLSVIVIVNAPTAVGSSDLLGHGVLISNKLSQTSLHNSSPRTGRRSTRREPCNFRTLQVLRIETELAATLSSKD